MSMITQQNGYTLVKLHVNILGIIPEEIDFLINHDKKIV